MTSTKEMSVDSVLANKSETYLKKLRPRTGCQSVPLIHKREITSCTSAGTLDLVSFPQVHLLLNAASSLIVFGLFVGCTFVRCVVMLSS